MDTCTLTIRERGDEEQVCAAVGTTLAEALRAAGRFLPAPCGGRGVCGHCRILASGALSAPNAEEAKLLGTSLSDGMRLACRAVILGDCVVEWQPAEQITPARGSVMPARDGSAFARCGAAIDIGTTTLCARLYLPNGQMVERSARNPQAAFGADVISRIGAAMSGQGAILRGCVADAITALLASLCDSAMIPLSSVEALVCTGNTAMLYLLTGRNPTCLSAAPFRADWLFDDTVSAQSLGFPLDASCYLPRCISAFVGADALCAALASGMTDRSETALLADVGTNGEIALWHDGQLICCSTAAGPAFEGAQIACGRQGVPGAIDTVRTVNGCMEITTIDDLPPNGICGSGLLDAIAAMRRLGIMDASGRIVRPTSSEDAGRIYLADGVYLTQRDVRNVQLAKSALRAGIDALLHREGISAKEIDRFYIAGGFGSFLNIDHAAEIGMFPAALAPRAVSIGNGALEGASMLLLDDSLRRKASALAAASVCRDLSADAYFQEDYIENMSFPE